MPYISIEAISKQSKEQKAEIIEKTTKLVSEITQIPEKFFIVTINELSDEDMGVEGKTVEKIRAEM